MAWAETSKGIWERPIGENESFIKLIGDSTLSSGRESWMITAYASFTLTPSLSQDQQTQIFRSAWAHLRFAQPSIAAIATDTHITYSIPNSNDLTTWLDSTFFVAKPTTNLYTLIANPTPSPYAILHYLPHESCIVLQTSHWRTDGIGILLILDAYFDHVCSLASTDNSSELTWGTEPTRLTRAVEELANLPLDPIPETTETANKYLATFALSATNTGLPVALSPSSPTPQSTSSTKFKTTTLSQSLSTKIFSSLKSNSITMTSAVHASVAAANYHFSLSHLKDNPYTSTIRFGLRPYLPDYAGHDYGTCLMTSGFMYQLPPGRSWVENARDLGSVYARGYAGILPAHRLYAKLLGEATRAHSPTASCSAEQSTESSAKPNQPENETVRGPSEMDISSLGIVDKYIRPSRERNGIGLEVWDVGVGTEQVSAQSVLFVWTFRERLNVSLWFNGAYHGEEMDGVVEWVLRRLCEELGVRIDGNGNVGKGESEKCA